MYEFNLTLDMPFDEADKTVRPSEAVPTGRHPQVPIEVASPVSDVRGEHRMHPKNAAYT